MSLSVLQRIALGDTVAVAECIEKYGAIVWGIARRFSRSSSDAEDATQEVFLDIWRSAPRYKPELGSDTVFIATIARRRLIDRLRKSRLEPLTVSIDGIDFASRPSSYEFTAEVCADADQVSRAVAQLRPEYRQVMELALLHGLSHSEIAAKLEMPVGSVKSYLRRALIEVRESMNIRQVSGGARV